MELIYKKNTHNGPMGLSIGSSLVSDSDSDSDNISDDSWDDNDCILASPFPIWSWKRIDYPMSSDVEAFIKDVVLKYLVYQSKERILTFRDKVDISSTGKVDDVTRRGGL